MRPGPKARLPVGHQRYNRWRSFLCALRGLGFLLRWEKNTRIELAATIVTYGAGVYLGFTAADFAIVSLAVGVVFVAEAVNTAVETVVDLASPEYHELAKRAKDVAAGAVLTATIFAALVGVFLFLPLLLRR